MSEYKRGYSNGYHAGSIRADRKVMEITDFANRAAKRAELAEKTRGVGHCEDCAHWLRPKGCAWGHCKVPRSAGTPYGTWAHGEDGESIDTSPTFGCVLFLAKTA